MPLLLMVGLPAYIVGAALNSASLADPNLKPTIWGFDAPMAVAVLGGLLAALASGPLAMVGLGAAIAGLVSNDGVSKVRQGLSAQGMQAAAAAAQIPGAVVSPVVPMLPGPGPAAAAAPAAPAAASWWDSLFN